MKEHPAHIIIRLSKKLFPLTFIKDVFYGKEYLDTLHKLYGKMSSISFAIAKNEADEKIKADRKDKNNKYEYQANVNTLIGSMRERLADAMFSRNPLHRIKKLNYK